MSDFVRLLTASAVFGGRPSRSATQLDELYEKPEMTLTDAAGGPLQNTDRLFIGGDWVIPSSAAMIDVFDAAWTKRSGRECGGWPQLPGKEIRARYC